MELLDEFRVILEVEVFEVVLGDEVVVDLVEEVAENLLVETGEVVEVLQRNLAAELGLTILPLILESENRTIGLTLSLSLPRN